MIKMSLRTLSVSFVALVGLCTCAASLHAQQAPNSCEKEAALTKNNFNISSSVVKTLLTKEVEAIYPAGAQKIKDPVVLQVCINASGSVEVEKLIRGPEELLPAATEAALQWHFRPYRMTDRPVPVTALIEIHFRKKIF